MELGATETAVFADAHVHSRHRRARTARRILSQKIDSGIVQCDGRISRAHHDELRGSRRYDYVY